MYSLEQYLALHLEIHFLLDLVFIKQIMFMFKAFICCKIYILWPRQNTYFLMTTALFINMTVILLIN